MLHIPKKTESNTTHKSALHAGMVWQTPVVAYGMGTADAGKNIAEGVNDYKLKIESLIGKSHVSGDW
jgi:glutathione-regulated potassium-efflux system ancillary protein KefG